MGGHQNIKTQCWYIYEDLSNVLLTVLQSLICILEFRFYCKLKVTLGVKLIVNFSNVQLNVAWTKNLAARHIAMTQSKCKRYQKMKSLEILDKIYFVTLK